MRHKSSSISFEFVLLVGTLLVILNCESITAKNDKLNSEFFKFLFLGAVERPDMRIKILEFISKVQKLSAKKSVSKSLRISEGGKDLTVQNKLEVFKTSHDIVSSLANELGNYYYSEWEHRFLQHKARFERVLKDQDKEMAKEEKNLEETRLRYNKVMNELRTKSYCNQKCSSWCGSVTCPISNSCPGLDGVDRCAGVPTCVPALRCTPRIVNLKSVYETEVESSSRSSFSSRASLKSHIKKRINKMRSATDDSGEPGGRFPGTDKFYKFLGRIGGNSPKSVAIFKNRTANIPKSLISSRLIEEMYDLLIYFKEADPSDKVEQSQEDKQQVLKDGVAAILFHTLPVEELTGKKDKKCPSCFFYCPEVFSAKHRCGYRCPNKPGCNIYKCICV